MSYLAEQDASWQRLIDKAGKMGYRRADPIECVEYWEDICYFSCGGPRFLPIAKYGET